MSDIKSILLHLDSSSTGATRLQAAQALAQAHGASVQALYAVTPVERLYPYVFAAEAPMAAQMAAFQHEQRKTQREVFEKLRATAGAQAHVHWRETSDDPVRGFVHHAFAADLLMLGQATPEEGSFAGVDGGFVPSVLIDSGKPALVLPYIHHGPVKADTVMLAWKPSPSAARAAGAALPWLQRARQVHVLVWSEQAHGDEDKGKAITTWLQHHGVTAIVHHGAPARHDLGEQMLSRAADLQADLLVMGCYGHSRTREWLLGGATRTVLAAMTLPVLMAH
jgi:nucleotide-binding universal stress UspA family protein